MSNSVHRVRHEVTFRNEVAELLDKFLNAASAEQIANSIARSVCNLSRVRSVVYIAAIEGTSDSSPLAIGAYGSSSLFMDYEYWKASGEQGVNFGAFRTFAESFGWKDLDSEFVLELEVKASEGSKLYCRKIEDQYGIFLGFVCIESSFNPFEYSGFDDAVFVMSVGALRFFQAQGKYGSQAVILQKLIHDINGSLSVIGLQAELLKLQSNIENQFVEAEQRIKSALNKADASVRSLNEFSHLFYPESLSATGNTPTSIPEVALSAAFSSLRFTADQLAKFHITKSISEFERVRVPGVVLYWITRAMLNAWAHPFFENEIKETDVFIHLSKTDGDPGFINLTMSRVMGLKRDAYLDFNSYSETELNPNRVVLMHPVQMMRKIMELFGGAVTFESTDLARKMTLSFPCYEEKAV